MKIKGRQHGVRKSFTILPSPLSQQRHVETVDSAGISTKVPSKPTNESKYTGKCDKTRYASCHINPACKSRDKAKGTMKLRSIGSDSGVNGCPVGISATNALAYLANEASYVNKDEYDNDDAIIDYENED